jgi:pyridoxal phosphate enzyme (YggS family)
VGEDTDRADRDRADTDRADTDGRQRDLAANLRLVRERLARACQAAGRDPGEVTLVAVTKTYPAEDVVRLAALGIGDVGENRDQEAAPKAAAVAEAGARVRWHFVGQLQRNKCRSVVRYADLVHSVDSVRLAEALDDAVQRHRDRPLDVLAQVNLEGAADHSDRGGTGELAPVLAAVEVAEGLVLRGLMAVAPLGWEPDRAFARLAEIAAATRDAYPSATLLSAGMSGDVEQAIQHGATHVRIGTALLGNRVHLM